MVCGHIKSLFQTVFGIFMFGGVVLSGTYTLGLLLNLTGGVLYGWNRYRLLKETTRPLDIK
eukprot:jgi/Galph1/2078/GphlegSOOS_G768.1